MSEETTEAVGGPGRPSPASNSSPPSKPSLMVVDEPATEEHPARILQRPRRQIADALRELADEYTVQGRGFELRLTAGGWRFYSRPEYAAAVEGFVLDGQHARLTQAALETLAVVAYRQPVSRGRVPACARVNCDGVMRTPPPAGPGWRRRARNPKQVRIPYVTTNYFLERMGLRGPGRAPSELAPSPEAAAIEAETLEGGPVVRSGTPRIPRTQTTRRNFDAKQQRQEQSAETNGGSRWTTAAAAAGAAVAAVTPRCGSNGNPRRAGGNRDNKQGGRPKNPRPEERRYDVGPGATHEGLGSRAAARRPRGGAGGRAEEAPQRGRSVPATSREYEARAEERNRERLRGQEGRQAPRG